MNSRKALTIIMAISMMLGNYQSFAQTAEELFPKAIQLEEVKGELEKAIEVYQTIVTQFSANRLIASKAQLHIGLCYEKLGDAQAREARKAYERVVRDYADQVEPTKVARERLKALIGGAGGTTSHTEVAMRRIWVAGKVLPICISPDGRYVVFGVYDSGNLWLRDLQSGEQRQITHEGSNMESMFATGTAAISPDGKWIVYSWQNKSFEELRLSKLDGSSMRILHNGQDGRSMNVTATAWMPDGRQILTISFKNMVNSPHIISLQDGSVRDISQPEPGSVIWGYPSPDGRHIAFSLNEDIFVHNTATEKDTVIIKTPSADGMVGWTPDGSGIMFVSNRSGSRDLYLLGIQNGRPHGEPQLLRRDLGGPMSLYVTRDGRLFQIENKGTWDSYTVPVDKQTGKLTGTPSLVAPGYSKTNFPAWSPDGKLLYYSRYKLTETNRSMVLVIRSEETGQTREITPKPELPFWHTPILSMDGSRFAVTGADQNGNSGVFTIDSESGAVSQLLGNSTANDPVECPNWSPDGKAIYYMIRSPEKREELIIRRKDITTGEEKDVHRGIPYNEIKISHDGTRFAYFMIDEPTKSYVLGILDIQSGKELELWRVPGAEYPGGIGGISWAPDGKYVLISLSQKMGNELWRVPATGGLAEKLYFFPESTWGIVMHPSGTRLAFAQSRINFELWVMENFLSK